MLAGTQKPMLGTKLNRAHPLADGLVGCWLFNEGVGNIAYDSSGYGNHGTLTNMAFPSTTASGWNPGRTGKALTFDGLNDSINFGNNASLNLTDAITIVIRMKLAVIAGENFILHKTHTIFSQFFQTNGYLKWYIRIGGSDHKSYISEKLFEVANQWYHFVTTWKNDGTLKAYVDGKEVGVTKNVGNFVGDAGTNTNPLISGGFTNYHLPGSIDSIILYNRAFLSATEVKWLYYEPYAMFERGELLL